MFFCFLTGYQGDDLEILLAEGKVSALVKKKIMEKTGFSEKKPCQITQKLKIILVTLHKSFPYLTGSDGFFLTFPLPRAIMEL